MRKIMTALALGTVLVSPVAASAKDLPKISISPNTRIEKGIGERDVIKDRDNRIVGKIEPKAVGSGYVIKDRDNRIVGKIEKIK